MTTGASTRRIPMFVAAACPSRSEVHTSSTGRSASSPVDAIDSNPAACSSDGPSATITTEVPAGA